MIILAQNISIIRNQEYILKDLSIQFKPNQSNIILGGSGAGKSCLIKACVGLMKINSGKITIDGKDIKNIALHDIGFVFQSNALFDSLTIKENIVFGLDTQPTEQRIVEILKNVNLLDMNILNKYPNEISGGMQKRIAIARSIIRDNIKVLFLDEPTTGLDPATSKTMAQTVKNISNKLNLTIISITHDIQFAKSTGDHFFLLQDKKVIWDSKTLDIKNSFVSSYLNNPAS